MKRRGFLIVLAVFVVACAVVGVLISTSGAAFTSSNSSKIQATSADVAGLLHLYSQSTDPDGLTGYYTKLWVGGLAATGVDHSLTVDLGPSLSTDENRVFTIKAPATLPTGVTSITVRATLAADSGGTQPIAAIGFAAVGNTARTNPVTLTAGQKMQCNMHTDVGLFGGSYHPTVILTVTYTGFTGSFYQYRVPVAVRGLFAASSSAVGASFAEGMSPANAPALVEPSITTEATVPTSEGPAPTSEETTTSTSPSEETTSEATPPSGGTTTSESPSTSETTPASE
jgi:hypothetical protein